MAQLAGNGKEAQYTSREAFFSFFVVGRAEHSAYPLYELEAELAPR